MVVISEFTRLSRSTKDLFAIVDQIKSKGADIKSLKETWLDKTTPQDALKMYDGGFLVNEVCKSCGISKSALYNFISERRERGVNVI